MKYAEAIARANQLRPNLLDDAMKAEWLHELDCEMAETMDAEEPKNLWPEEQELLMPAPKDGCYVDYLCARIDYANEDTATYVADRQMAERSATDAKAWWRRNHRSLKNPKWRCWL